jgi:hypothetical protein
LIFVISKTAEELKSLGKVRYIFALQMVCATFNKYDRYGRSFVLFLDVKKSQREEPEQMLKKREGTVPAI